RGIPTALFARECCILGLPDQAVCASFGRGFVSWKIRVPESLVETIAGFEHISEDLIAYAALRIRIVRRGLPNLRRQIHFAPPPSRAGTDQMSALQKAGPQNHFDVQLAGEAQT